nr:expressed protein [Hymenolepis microstoma]
MSLRVWCYLTFIVIWAVVAVNSTPVGTNSTAVQPNQTDISSILMLGTDEADKRNEILQGCNCGCESCYYFSQEGDDNDGDDSDADLPPSTIPPSSPPRALEDTQ